MKNSRMLIVAAVAICGVAFASTGVSQTKTTTVKTSKTSKVTTTSKTSKKVEGTERETNEQRLRRLKNDQTEIDCIEKLKNATRAESVEYDEGQCKLTIKRRGNTPNAHVWLGVTDWNVSSNGITFTCRTGQRGQCAEGSRTSETSVSVPLYGANSGLKQCIDFLHQRCKKM